MSAARQSSKHYYGLPSIGSASRAAPADSPRNGTARIARRSGPRLRSAYLQSGQNGQLSMGQSLQSHLDCDEVCARAAAASTHASEINAIVRFIRFSLTLKQQWRLALRNHA
jgi:hypothetical protein